MLARLVVEYFILLFIIEIGEWFYFVVFLLMDDFILLFIHFEDRWERRRGTAVIEPMGGAHIRVH